MLRGRARKAARHLLYMPLHTFRRARKFADSLSKMANKMAHRQWQPRSIRQFVNALACGKLSKLGARHRVPQSLMNGWQNAGGSSGASARRRAEASARRRSCAEAIARRSAMLLQSILSLYCICRCGWPGQLFACCPVAAAPPPAAARLIPMLEYLIRHNNPIKVASTLK